MSDVPFGDLDEAWAEAEAALPLVGWMHEGRWIIPSGSWIIGIEYRPSSGDGYFEPHYEAAYVARAQIRGHQVQWFVGEEADTPAAALRVLAAKLRADGGAFAAGLLHETYRQASGNPAPR